MPPPFFHLKDIWGFYNGNNSLTYVHNVNNSNVPIGVTKPIHEITNNDVIGLCFIKFGSNSVVLNAKPGYAKNGLLKSITYPTGGSLSYEYAQNEGLIENQNTIVGGVHVSKTIVIDGGYSNNCCNPIITNYNYRSEASGAVSSLWGMEMPKNFVETKTFYEPEDKYFGFVSLVTVGCNYRYKYPGIQSGNRVLV